jgi:hypothetical protein
VFVHPIVLMSEKGHAEVNVHTGGGVHYTVASGTLFLHVRTVFDYQDRVHVAWISEGFLVLARF